jgi:hypothetical protein
MVEALCCKPEDREFESWSLYPRYCPGVYSEDLSGGKPLPARKADNLTAIYEPIV